MMFRQRQHVGVHNSHLLNANVATPTIAICFFFDGLTIASYGKASSHLNISEVHWIDQKKKARYIG